MDIEDRIFELTGKQSDGRKVIAAVAEEYGLDWETASSIYVRVRRERGTPYRVRTREAIDRLGRISFI
jgi:hypothetical protein